MPQRFIASEDGPLGRQLGIGDSHLEISINKNATGGHYKIHNVCFHIHKFLSSLVFNMKRLKFLTTIYFLYFSGVLAHPTIDDNETTNEADREEEEKETCDEIFATNGMNFTSFYEGAAHGIHSLRLNIMRCMMIIHGFM